MPDSLGLTIRGFCALILPVRFNGAWARLYFSGAWGRLRQRTCKGSMQRTNSAWARSSQIQPY